MKIRLTEENVLLTGRTYKEEDTLWLAMSGTGASFVYTGKKLTITAVGGPAANVPDNNGNYARFAVYADDLRVVDDLMDCAEKTYTIWESAEIKKVLIRIVKLSECAMSVLGIKDPEIAEGESIVPVSPKEHMIEFIGDSITCGFGVDDEDPLHSFSTATEDVTKAYAYKTALLLNADYSMFSESGYGILSGYTDDPERKCAEELIPPYYESYGFSYDSFPGGKKPQEMVWNFTGRKPEAIVINLGTNDDSYCQDTFEKQVEFRNEYVRFLKKVRRNNPDSYLFCVLGLMEERLYPMVEEACKLYRKETKDERIRSFRLPEQDKTAGYAADYHPLASAHDLAAAKAAEEIRNVMGW